MTGIRTRVLIIARPMLYHWAILLPVWPLIDLKTWLPQRVYDEDVQKDEEAPKADEPEKSREEKEAELVPKIAEAVKLGMAVLDSAYDKLEVRVHAPIESYLLPWTFFAQSFKEWQKKYLFPSCNTERLLRVYSYRKASSL